MPTLQRALTDWYDAAHRDLPWRRTADPYAILVSEVMLQQTQVSRVIPRYEAWIERWPSAASLAAAPRGEILAAWVGLGYNRRALRLHEACVIVARDGWPGDAAGLRALPGVGPYTAAAVASFAFGEVIAAVDVNVARVAARLGVGEPDELLDRAGPARWNQAVMELGATVCRARSADCPACPVAGWCRSAGRVPEPAVRTGSPVRFEDTNRWVRGRIVASLAAGGGLPQDVSEERLAPALEGLVRDGLVRREPGGHSLG